MDAFDQSIAPEIQSGDRAGPYQIVRPLPGGGQGGMSQLYEVQVRHGYQEPGWPARLVLKVAKLEYQDHLKEEADYLKRFDHPNVIRIYPLPGRQKDVYLARQHFRIGWRCYYAMELVPGGSLREWLDKQKRLSIHQAVNIARQLAAALGHIHRRGVINLDLKPGNVLLRRRPGFLGSDAPQAVLCDFGIARELGRELSGVPGIGTPEYTSPEQIQEMGQKRPLVDQRSDLFLLGITLYEMLTGQVPFDNIGLIAQSNVPGSRPSILNPAVPPELDQVVLRLLEKPPDRRYASAHEVDVALAAVPIPTNRGRAAYWALLGCLLFLFLGLMAVMVVLLIQAL